MKAANIVLNALRPRYAREMVHKLVLRWRERRSAGQRSDIEDWCRARAVDVGEWANSRDPGLWAEACKFADEQRRVADKKLRQLGIDLGGGGAYHLLYFLTRRQRLDVVVETGVAAGFSSRAFLSAMRANGHGRLLSSDFPYFRLHAPEQYVGFLVEPELRGEWQPLLDGDRQNLAQIVRQVSKVDLVHYDSDKSYDGRQFALRTLGPLLSADGIVLFDDIQDNWHFRDISRGRPFRVFGFEGKWVGMIGGPADFYQ